MRNQEDSLSLPVENQLYIIETMKKVSIFAVATTLLLAACAEKPGYEIAGTVAKADAEGQYVYLQKWGVDEAPLDSALITNGKFTLKGEQAAPLLCVLRLGSEELKRGDAGENQAFTAVFTLENAKMQALLDDKAPVVTGTPENDGFKALQDQVKGIRAAEEALTDQLKSADEAVKNAAIEKAEAIEAEASKVVTAYVKANSDKQIAAKVFSDARYDIAEADQDEIVAGASEAFKAVPGINKMIDHLNILKNSAVGKAFIDFEMADADGKMHKLSEYVGKGKVVLIDFWASWCPPCRRDMPNMVEIYKQYKNKGFEIVGISLDSKADAWAKGVKDLNITWPQLSDLQGWKNAGAALYGVNSIPHTVLVDKDGTILVKGLHAKEVGEKLKELLK